MTQSTAMNNVMRTKPEMKNTEIENTEIENTEMKKFV